MSAQQAYLSTDSAQPLGGYAWTDRGLDAAATAEREARRILGKTEPANYPSSCGPASATYLRLTRNPSMMAVHEAIAEALATFINASIE